MAKAKKILVIHGPNLNMLGKREPEIYGRATLDEINKDITGKGASNGLDVQTFQSNHEGAIIDKIQECFGNIKGIIINPGAYTHTSIGIRDAILSVNIPVIEIHLSNIYKRETFRHKSMIADIAVGQISGFGIYGYMLAIDAMMNFLSSS
ncbi:MAG: type II 3-dehydroquinate dehydratase [Proteobacteria bacterium]|nr:type II 3-dehydroquinate dehydratase [Pseudomonadota bacterium]